MIAGLLWFRVAARVLSIPAVPKQLVRGSRLRLAGDDFRKQRPWKWRSARCRDARELRAMNRSLVGRTSSLPDAYGLPVEERQALMDGWRERALRTG